MLRHTHHARLVAFALLCSLPQTSLLSQTTTTTTTSPTTKTVTKSVSKFSLDNVEKSIVDQTNQLRMSHGRQPVEISDELTAAAQDMADFMARTGSFGHYSDGRNPSSRARTRKYDSCPVLENIAYTGSGNSDLASYFYRTWRNSSGHFNNMLNSSMTQTGVGLAYGSGGRVYAVQMFGRPYSRVTSFKIQNASEETIEYVVAGDKYSLPPKTLRTHRRCREPNVVFKLPEEAKDELETEDAENEEKVAEPTVTPDSEFTPAVNDHFIVTNDENGPRVFLKAKPEEEKAEKTSPKS